MLDCCTDTLNLGCICHCDTLDTGIPAPETGVYTVELFHAGAIRKKDTAAITAPANITFDVGGFFNENKINKFRILDPSGNYVTSGGADCFEVDVRVCTDAE